MQQALLKGRSKHPIAPAVPTRFRASVPIIPTHVLDRGLTDTNQITYMVICRKVVFVGVSIRNEFNNESGTARFLSADPYPCLLHDKPGGLLVLFSLTTNPANHPSKVLACQFLQMVSSGIVRLKNLRERDFRHHCLPNAGSHPTHCPKRRFSRVAQRTCFSMSSFQLLD